MLHPEDRTFLLNNSGAKEKRKSIVSLCILCLFAVLFVVKLYLATKWAGFAGYSMSRLVPEWFQGTQAEATYSGTQIKAFDDLTGAFVYMAASLFLSVVLYMRRQATGRTERIIQTLQDAGAW